MPNILPVVKQLAVLQLLIEGNSISSTARITGAHRDTCMRLLLRFGEGCKSFLDRELRDLTIDHVQLDEIWTFCRKKKYRVTGDEPDLRNIGDIYIFVAFDEETRLVPAHRVGKRDQLNTNVFMYDLAHRLKKPKPHASDDHAFKVGNYKPIVRISTDGFAPYLPAIENFFGPLADYALLEKDVKGSGKNKTVEITKTIIKGEIDPKDVSTSLVERNNLTIRTFMRRLTRKSLGFSKRLENLRAATAMHFAYYNYCWKIKTIKTTPAAAAGVVKKPLTLAELYKHVRDCAPQNFFDDKAA